MGIALADRAGIGRISARISSDGPALAVDALDIVDLAGANARVAGRIEPDGSGRIAGKVTAKRAAPLVDLLGRVWIGGLSRLVPYFLREGDLELIALIVSPRSRLSYYGYERGAVNGPAVISKIVEWLHRDSHIIPWECVALVGDDGISLGVEPPRIPLDPRRPIEQGS